MSVVKVNAKICFCQKGDILSKFMLMLEFQKKVISMAFIFRMYPCLGNTSLAYGILCNNLVGLWIIYV